MWENPFGISPRVKVGNLKVKVVIFYAVSDRSPRPGSVKYDPKLDFAFLISNETDPLLITIDLLRTGT
jgi:hypothetical protein